MERAELAADSNGEPDEEWNDIVLVDADWALRQFQICAPQRRNDVEQAQKASASGNIAGPCRAE